MEATLFFKNQAKCSRRGLSVAVEIGHEGRVVHHAFVENQLVLLGTGSNLDNNVLLDKNTSKVCSLS